MVRWYIICHLGISDLRVLEYDVLVSGGEYFSL